MSSWRTPGSRFPLGDELHYQNGHYHRGHGANLATAEDAEDAEPTIGSTTRRMDHSLNTLAIMDHVEVEQQANRQPAQSQVGQ